MSFNGFCIGETDYFPRYVYKSDVLREENMSTVIEKWDEILEIVKKEHDLSDVRFDTWLKPLKVFDVSGNVVTIIASDQKMFPPRNPLPNPHLIRITVLRTDAKKQI